MQVHYFKSRDCCILPADAEYSHSIFSTLAEVELGKQISRRLAWAARAILPVRFCQYFRIREVRRSQLDKMIDEPPTQVYLELASEEHTSALHSPILLSYAVF